MKRNILATQIDFSGAPLDSVMRENFDALDTVAGDAPAPLVMPFPPYLTVGVPTEIVGFSVVCERDPITGNCPTKTKSGKTLNP